MLWGAHKRRRAIRGHVFRAVSVPVAAMVPVLYIFRRSGAFQRLFPSPHNRMRTYARPVCDAAHHTRASAAGRPRHAFAAPHMLSENLYSVEP